MLNNQPQAGKREVHRLDFFRPDQLVCLVTHETPPNEPLPELTLMEWVTRLSDQMSKNEDLPNTSAKFFVAGLCEQLNNDEQLPGEQLNAWTVEFGKKMDAEGWRLIDPQPRSYTFPPISGLENADESWQETFNDAFSLIVCNLEKKEPPDKSGAEEILNRMGISAKDANKPGETNDNEADDNKDNATNEERGIRKIHLLDLILRLNQPETVQNLNFAGLTMRAITPNWIASSGKSDSGGTGGPGGEPVPYAGYSEQVPYYFDELISKIRGAHLDENDPYRKGRGVDVIILDTAPCGHDLVLAHKELVSARERRNQKGHPLIKTLLGPKGKLKLYPATYEQLLRMGSTSLNKQGYKMEDHGLFIAGIIHSIVPGATIHLIEVLNQFGVGDFETIARGLAKAYAIARQNNRPLVVNGSWLFDIPHRLKKDIYSSTKKESIGQPERDMEEVLRIKIKDELDRLKPKLGDQGATDELSWVLALRVVCERLGKAGMQIIAAAGNEGKGTKGSRNAPEARYPAAFSKVVGVGALPKDADRGDGKYDASTFSNLADKPPQTGVMTLGGEPGEDTGVLGIYLGEFPLDDSVSEPGWDKPGRKSENGWGWWAGTSFATPILTGAVAAVLSGPENYRTTQQAIHALYTESIIEDGKTDADEDVMSSSLSQTYPPL